MKQYIIRRVLLMIPILIGVSFLIYMIFTLAPGNIVTVRSTGHMTAATQAKMMHEYHLDQPKVVQYLYWAKDAIVGNFGESYKFKAPVSKVMGEFIWNSFFLSLASFIAAFAIAIPIGIISATKQYSIFDKVFTVISLAGISIPSFFLGLVLIKIFAIDLPIFPLSGMTTTGSNNTGLAFVGDVLYHMVLPFLVLTFQSIASIMRYVRTSMLEVIRQDYIRTARAKGLKEKVVIYKHALRNGLIPVITLFGILLPSLFAGAIVTEYIFSWPGIGNVTLQAVNVRDYPLLMGINMLLAVLTLVGNLIADVSYAVVDPRIRLK